MLKRWLISLIALLLTAALVACNNSGDKPDETDDGTTAVAVEETTTVVAEETTTVAVEETTTVVVEETTTVVVEETTAEPEPITVSPDDIPVYSGGKSASNYDSGCGSYMKYINGTTAAEFNSYTDTLVASGYSLRYARDLSGCLFREYAKDGVSVYAYFAANTKDVRIIVSPYIRGLYNNPATGNCEVLFTMVGINFTSVPNGMSFLIRTANGSFIVIDGGWGGQGEAQKLLALMQEQNLSAEKPVVAAWILTHPHSDHIGAFSDFSQLLYNEIVLERVIFNFVSDATMEASDSVAMITNKSSYYSNIRSALNSEKKWKSAEIITPHSGQLLEIDGVKLDFLYTEEDTYPRTDDLAYMNGTSLVFKLTAAGKSVFIMGDSSLTNNKYMYARYNSAVFKSDYLQPTHHGTTHGYIELYSAVAADACFWCTSRTRMKDYDDRNYNIWLMANVIAHYVSSDGNTTLNFSNG